MITDNTADDLLIALRRHLAAERWVEVAVLLEALTVVAPEIVYAIRDEIRARVHRMNDNSDTTESADWCVDTGALAICGTRMREHWRQSEGERWCFHCRIRHEFFRVLMVPDGPSYYDPYPRIVGPKSDCTDLFPGWSRTWDDE